MNDAPVMLVAGGTGSIGRVIAAQALAAGWRVIIQGSSVASVAACIASLVGDSSTEQLHGIDADLKQANAIETVVEQASAWAGRLDAVIDCVSMGPTGARLTGLFAETDSAGYAALLDLSIGHLQRLTHAALPWLTQSSGTLIAFASDAGRFAAVRQTIVGASRAAIMGFIRNLAVEVARTGVRAHCISPSFVAETNTARRLAEHSPARVERAAGRAGLGLPTPEDIAPLVIFLCSAGARKITGQVISINGGLNA